ncbi:hypothetical protein ACP4OV_026612 [Aristida adscensionis]
MDTPRRRTILLPDGISDCLSWITSIVGDGDGDVDGGSTTATAAALKTEIMKKKAPQTAFRCPACGHEGSVECRISVKARYAAASCWECEASYGTRAVDALTEAVDVYGQWVDERDGAGDAVMADA